MIRRTAILSIGVALAAAQQASARTDVDYAAQAGDGTSVIIKPFRSSGDAQYWCAASDYMRATFDSPGVARIYVTQPRSRGAAQFALEPPTSGAVQSLGISVGTLGNNMSVAEAQQFCYNRATN